MLLWRLLEENKNPSFWKGEVIFWRGIREWKGRGKVLMGLKDGKWCKDKLRTILW